MHWADEIAEKIIKSGKHQPYWIDDMKTPSGVIHVGSLRGVLVHELVARALHDRGEDVTHTYIYNDMDPMDKRPGYIDESYDEHLGKPFFMVPAPDGTSESYAVQFANQFTEVFNYLGCKPEIIWSSKEYKAGKMNQVITEALDNVEKIRNIYLEVAGQEKPEGWYPFQPICPECGKVGSTLVTDWDGEKVTFSCQPDMVAWAKGCGYQGEISPLNGSGKLMWKVDWPAHWKAIGITVEGEGKDHSSDGGSRDVANRLIKEVFDYESPYDIPYEWFLIGGRKMSTSKGVGTSAQDFADVLPPELGRFLFVRNHFNKQINFDPSGDTIPDLFDSYDESAQLHWSGDDGKIARSYVLSQMTTEVPEEMYLPRFRDVAKYLQDPKIDLVEKFSELKGSELTDAEHQTLQERAQYAKLWLDQFASDEDVVMVSELIPEEASQLSNEQIAFLATTKDLLDQDWEDPQDLQQEIFEQAKASIGPKPAFQAIYLSLIGKKYGPKAAWFLLDNKEMAQQRFDRLQKLDVSAETETKTIRVLESKHLTLDTAFADEYPTASVGWAVIEGVSIEKENPELEAEKAEVMQALELLTTEKLAEFSEIESYRTMYKSMRVKYQSRRPSPEALLRRVAQGKGLYTVNTLVDAYNLVVMRNRISVGAFDMAKVQFPTTLKIAEGGEKILLLGDDEPTILKEGEVSYFDQEGPYNLDYNYRDAQRTAISMDTKNVWINVDGIGEITPAQVERTLEETIEMILKYCGGKVIDKGMLRAG